jgi:hypothetical protein
MRRTLLPLSLIFVVLVAFGAWTLGVRPGASTRVHPLPGVERTAIAPTAPRLDTADETWHLMPLPPAAAAAHLPGRRPVLETTPAPDWSALRLDVAAAPSPTVVAVATAPAELEIAMSARERRALIAAARDPEGPPPPRGYRPGIAVIIPGGSSSDGVCR